MFYAYRDGTSALRRAQTAVILVKNVEEFHRRLFVMDMQASNGTHLFRMRHNSNPTGRSFSPRRCDTFDLRVYLFAKQSRDYIRRARRMPRW